MTRREFSYTSLKRTFSLPEHVDGDNINANYKEGILMLILLREKKQNQSPQEKFRYYNSSKGKKKAAYKAAFFCLKHVENY